MFFENFWPQSSLARAQWSLARAQWNLARAQWSLARAQWSLPRAQWSLARTECRMGYAKTQRKNRILHELGPGESKSALDQDVENYIDWLFWFRCKKDAWIAKIEEKRTYGFLWKVWENFTLYCWNKAVQASWLAADQILLAGLAAGEGLLMILA